jgi:hypothetical protein
MRKVSAISTCNSLTHRPSVALESMTNDAAETCRIENIYPLLITDSILQQCNFIFHDYFKVWRLGSRFQPGTEMEIDLNYNLIDFLRRPVIKKITSLHQLQNIYYIVYGIELDLDADVIGGNESMLSAFASN